MNSHDCDYTYSTYTCTFLYNTFSSYPAGRAVYHLQQLWARSKNCHFQEKWCPGHGRISFTALGLVSNLPTKSKDTLEKSLALKSLYILVKLHKTCELQIWLKYLLPHSFRVPVSILNLGFCLSFSTKVFFSGFAPSAKCTEWPVLAKVNCPRCE